MAIQIKPMGSYFALDADGYIINPTSLEKIGEKWKPVVDAVVGAYKKECGELLRNVFIRGSVAKGQAIDNVSDIDTMAFIDLPKDEIDRSWTRDAARTIQAKFPFANGIELVLRPFDSLTDDVSLLNQAVCVYGQAPDIPKLKPGKDLLRHLPVLRSSMERYDRRLGFDLTLEEIEEECVWFMKNTLRAGFELTMERSGRYTRDLYLCYKDFSEYYPNKEALMKEVLSLALSPTADKLKIKQLKDALIPWMIDEARTRGVEVK